jgi:ubiquinone/menaquinone biosynthesis C-methylase UbiE
MNSHISNNTEQRVATAFNGQSLIFDKLYSDDIIINYKRRRVREHLLKYLMPGSKILELNAGTGEDAIFLAKLGHSVHATDISSGMLEKLKEKVLAHQVADYVTSELCSYTKLESLKNSGPFDCIFSNFAGLNCTGDLDLVLSAFDHLLKPEGIVVLVILPTFCLWEGLLLFKGKLRTATRRLFSSGGRKAKIDGAPFTCWYYSPGYVVKRLEEKFKTTEIEGLCTIVPPSYMEKFPVKYPKMYSFLCKAENKLKNKWPWKNIGDYYIISLRRK